MSNISDNWAGELPLEHDPPAETDHVNKDKLSVRSIGLIKDVKVDIQVEM